MAGAGRVRRGGGQSAARAGSARRGSSGGRAGGHTGALDSPDSQLLHGTSYSTPSTSSGQAGESFEYGYDPVGNRTVHSATITTTLVTTYTYDAANRLTWAKGVGYTWDARGNLINDGVFMYTYNGAGRMVACLVQTG